MITEVKIVSEALCLFNARRLRKESNTCSVFEIRLHVVVKTSNSDWKSSIYEGKVGKLLDKSKIRTFLLILPDVS